MFQHFLKLEVLFEENGVYSGVITDSLILNHTVHGQNTVNQPLPTAPQLGNRQKGIQLLLGLTVPCAFPAQTSEFALQIFDLTHVWMTRGSGIIDSDDLLALAAAFYMHIQVHLSPQQRYPRSLPELLTACRSASC